MNYVFPLFIVNKFVRVTEIWASVPSVNIDLRSKTSIILFERYVLGSEPIDIDDIFTGPSQ